MLDLCFFFRTSLARTLTVTGYGVLQLEYVVWCVVGRTAETPTSFSAEWQSGKTTVTGTTRGDTYPPTHAPPQAHMNREKKLKGCQRSANNLTSIKKRRSNDTKNGRTERKERVHTHTLPLLATAATSADSEASGVEKFCAGSSCCCSSRCRREIFAARSSSPPRPKSRLFQTSCFKQNSLQTPSLGPAGCS